MATLILNPASVRQAAINRALPDVEKVLAGTLLLSRRYTPVRAPRIYDRRPTGRLLRSLRRRGPKVLRTRITGQVGSTLRYAASVHEGARPHVIRARNKRLLSFFWEREFTRFVGKKVNHPGIRRYSRTQYLYLPLVLVGRRHNFIVRRVGEGTGIPSPLASI